MAAKMSTNGQTLKFRAAKLKGFTEVGSVKSSTVP